MSLVFGNGSRTVTTGANGQPYSFGQPPQGGFDNTYGRGQQWQASGAPKSQPKAPNLSQYSPGSAQPVQSQNQGSPYQPYVNQSGQAFTGTMSFAPGTSQDYQNQAYGQWANRSGYYQQPVQQPSQQVSGDPRGAYAGTPSNRPAPFQMAPAQTPWGQSMDPLAERSNFVEQLNQQRMQRQLDFNNNGDFMPPTWGGSPTLNPQAAMQNAGLGGGAPSMASDYGDSLISRLNTQFGGPGVTPPAQQSAAPTQMGGIRHWTDNPAYQQPQVPAGWQGTKGSGKYASSSPLGSDNWWGEQNARAQAAQAAERPVWTPGPRQPASLGRQPTPPASPRAAATAVRQSGGSRQEASDAWRNTHRAQIASPANQRWLASQTPANRRIYQMLQAY